MAFAFLSPDATFQTRVAAEVVRPAIFVDLAWPTGDVRAHSHIGTVTTGGSPGTEWTGVGDFAKVELTDASLDGSAVEARIGLQNMIPAAAQASTEEDAIGVVGQVYLGLFDENYEDPVLDLRFYGYVKETARVKANPADDGYTVDLSILLDDRSNPRRAVRTYHAVGEGVSGDTSRQLMVATVGKDYVWPES